MGRPNVLYIFTDQQRVDTLRCYGNEQIETPALDALAADGFVFENAYVSQPVCSPGAGHHADRAVGRTLLACPRAMCRSAPRCRLLPSCCRRNTRRPLWANGTWGMRFFPARVCDVGRQRRLVSALLFRAGALGRAQSVSPLLGRAGVCARRGESRPARVLAPRRGVHAGGIH